ncbi:glycosyltransferase family 1 protein [Arthrobacter sp. UM1]|uniref:glycosyltransferase family 4 protein n=1 Tax=Arthrobacter sp. UM1 TaxID=2766776 RepID=UPI00299E136F|nr:glycosyltransferase family 1 protein [Arthrobacter sp. UM1]
MSAGTGRRTGRDGGGGTGGNRLKIAFDARYTRLERHDGISRFGSSLAAAAAELADVTLIVSDPRQLEMLPDLPHVLANSPTSWREPWALRSLRHLDADVVFSPMQTIGTWGRRHPLVLTIHDLIYYEHPAPPKSLPAPVRLLWRLYHLSYAPQRWLLRGADAVAVVSETTRRLLAEHRLTEAPVVVVSNAPADLEAARGGAEAPALLPAPAPGGDFVYMGSFMPYKGVETLIEAAGLRTGARLHLVSRADDATRRRLTALAAEKGADVVFHQGLSDADYAALLTASTGLVTASRAEGFGLPVVEALSLGVPAAVSDIPIFREVAGSAAVFADPRSAADMAEAMGRLVAEREELACRARQEAARYSWEASARALVKACETAIAEHRRKA